MTGSDGYADGEIVLVVVFQAFWGVLCVCSKGGADGQHGNEQVFGTHHRIAKIQIRAGFCNICCNLKQYIINFEKRSGYLIMKNKIQIDTSLLFPALDIKLIELLKSLSDEEWNAQTVAKRWTVKDIASHLLDGNLKGLSISRDGYFGEQASAINSFSDMVSFLNNLNMTWTSVTKRLSPKVLIELLEITGKAYSAFLTTLDPAQDSLLSVAWAGQEVSPNWFHIAREYTEKFLHQQQIRDATGRPGIMTKEFYYPFIDTLMYALPHTFNNVIADLGTTVTVVINSDIGGQWNVVKSENGWELSKEIINTADATVIIDPDTAWKLFSKSWRPAFVLDKIAVKGDVQLARKTLEMVSVMA